MEESFRAKGYKYSIQFVNSDTGKDFGDPVYFKDSLSVGAFMRENNLRMSLVTLFDAKGLES